jgi:hypothetical protein
MSTDRDEGPLSVALDPRAPVPGAGQPGFSARELTHRVTDRNPQDADGCSATTKQGRVCGRRVGLRDGLCPAHRPKPATQAPKRPMPPVAKLTTLADAIALASWAAIEAARGNISANQANAISSLAREFRMATADKGVYDRVETLLAQIEANTAEFARLRVIVTRYKERYGDL